MTEVTPNFFITGAPKCGTSSMGSYLAQHPEVFMVNEEPHFFGRDIAYNPEPLTKEQYLSLFEDGKDFGMVGERSTWYLFSEDAAGEIYDFCPKARIVIQIRNPIEVVHSLHNHLIHHSEREDITDLKEALDAESDRKQGLRIPEEARFPEHFFYTEIPKFSRQIRRYLDVFGWEQVRVVIFDDFVENTLREYRRTLEFLQIDSTFEPDLEVKNRGKQVKRRWLESVKLHPRVQELARIAFPRDLRDKVKDVIDQYAYDYEKQPMSDEVRDFLRKEFSSEVRELGDLLERDLTHWLQ